ncbi:hypothetical protein [Vibrio phage Va2]|nr:hypothetical protein [Vibrio phage Va2]
MFVKICSRLNHAVVVSVGPGEEDNIRLSPEAIEGPFERERIDEDSLPNGVELIQA